MTNGKSKRVGVLSGLMVMSSIVVKVGSLSYLSGRGTIPNVSGGGISFFLLLLEQVDDPIKIRPDLV